MVRIDPDGAASLQAASVQAGVKVEEGHAPLDITCATHSGGAQMAQLAAIRLSKLNELVDQEFKK